MAYRRTLLVLGIMISGLLAGCSTVQVRARPPQIDTEVEVLKVLDFKDCRAELLESGPDLLQFRLAATRLELVRERTTMRERKEVVRHSYSPVMKVGELGANYATLGFGVLTDLVERLQGDALDGTAHSETSYVHNLLLWGNWFNPLANVLVPDDTADRERSERLGKPRVSVAERHREIEGAPITNWPISVYLSGEGGTFHKVLRSDGAGRFQVDLFELLREAGLRNLNETTIKLELISGPGTQQSLAQHTFDPAQVIRSRLPQLAQGYGGNRLAAPELELTFEALEIVEGTGHELFLGGDKGLLKVTVNNRGKGDAFEVGLKLAGELGQLAAEAVVPLPILRAGAASQFAIPVSLPLLAKDGQARLKVKAVEALGNDSPMLDIILDYYRAQLPQLQATDVLIKDGQGGLAKGNGNGILENGEQAELWVTVTNVGPGLAKGATVSLADKTGGNVVVKGKVALGELLPAATKIAKLAIVLPPILDQGEVKLSISGHDNRGVGEFEKELSLACRQRQPKLAILTKVQSEGGAPVAGGAIEKGRSGILILAVENRGDYAAEAVELRLRSAEGGVVFSESRVPIGRIPSGAKSNQLEVPFVVQNRFSSTAIELQIEVLQKIFSSATATARVAVQEPKVRIVRLGNSGAVPAEEDQAPLIVLTYPRGDIRLRAEKVRLAGAVLDDRQVRMVEVWVNGARYTDLPGRGIAITRTKEQPKRRFFEMELPLVVGSNTIRVAGVDSLGQRSEESIAVYREPNTGRMHVLVVGVEDYDDPAIENLQFAMADARAVYRFFRLSTKSPARPENVHLLTDQADEKGCDNSYRGIRRAISRYLVQAAVSSEDMVLLYFAGHGKTAAHPSKGEASYLLPRDAEQGDLWGTAIESAEFQALWSSIPAGRRIFIADACESGAWAESDDGATADPAAGDSFFTSSRPGQKARELPEYEHGLFTWSLLRGLEGWADGILGTKDGRVSTAELKVYLDREVVPLARLHGGLQEPVIRVARDSEDVFLTK